jgi:hypothetical protein
MNNDRQSTPRITQRLSCTERCVRAFVETMWVPATGAELRAARAVLMIFLSRLSWAPSVAPDRRLRSGGDESLTRNWRGSSADRQRSPSRWGRHQDLNPSHNGEHPMQTIEAPTETIDRSFQEASEFQTPTSVVGRYLDIALVVALVGPPALVGLLGLLGLGFAVAVCVVFAAVFIITTAEDVTWMWRRRIDRENRRDLR